MSWLPPEQYVQTVPHATMYGALYFTDVNGHPLVLRSTQTAEAWQFPGGNVEHDDPTPFATAVRECQEETGIVFTGSPRLLLTHFLPPRPAWPLAKIGFIFDGGTLTDEELGRIVLDPTEHTEWLVRPLSHWRAVMSPRLFTRIRVLGEARGGGAVFLCEDVARLPSA